MGPGKCLRYYVDGMRWSPMGGLDEAPDTYLNGSEIGAVEIYSNIFAPAEFNIDNCYSVVIWTKWKLKM